MSENRHLLWLYTQKGVVILPFVIALLDYFLQYGKIDKKRWLHEKRRRNFKQEGVSEKACYT